MDAVSESVLLRGIATARSPKLLGMFQGAVFEYEILDDAEVERDTRRIERIYRSLGYYESRVTVKTTRTSPGHVAVEYAVDEGLPVRVETVFARGAERLPPEYSVGVLSEIDLQPGNILMDSKLSKSSEFIRHFLARNGYAWARVEYEVVVSLESRTARVTFEITPGLRAIFGRIAVIGAGSVDERSLSAAAGIEPGTLYSEEALTETRQNLARLTVFSNIDVSADLSEPASARVPINILVEEGEQRTLFLGGGFALDTRRFSVHANTGWEHRNFLGRLRRFALNSRPGVVLFPTRIPTDGASVASPTNALGEFRSDAEFIQPMFLEKQTQLEVRGGYDVTAFLIDEHVALDPQVIGFQEPSGSVRVSRPFFRNALEVGTSLNGYRVYPFAYLGEVPDLLHPLTVLFGALDAQLKLFRIERVQGLVLSTRFELARWGQVEDQKLETQVLSAIALANGAVLATRFKFGRLFRGNYQQPGVGAPDEPSTARSQQIYQFRGFFSGGPDSNRGYPYHGVGPHGQLAFLTPNSVCTVDDESPLCFRPLGGATLWESALELQFDLYQPSPDKLYRLSLFTDASDVSESLGFERPHLSAGIGLSIYTDVGPLKLDLGYRIPGLQVLGRGEPSNEEGRQGTVLGQPVTLHVYLGEAF